MFHATPQRSVEPRQSSPQTERSKNLSANCASAKAPSSSRKALVRMMTTGNKTKMAVRATTTPMAPTMKASPRHQPRRANPWHSSIRKAVDTRPAPSPMPGWLGPSVPRRSARMDQFQPRKPIAKPWIALSTSPPIPAPTSMPLACSRPDRINGQVATMSGGAISASHHAPSDQASPSAVRGPCVG